MNMTVFCLNKKKRKIICGRRVSYLLDRKPVIYLSMQGGADPIAFFVYGGTQKGLRWAKHEKHGHLREEKQTTGNTMIRLKVREQGLSTARST